MDHGQLKSRTHYICKTDGVEECLSKNTMCNGQCPEGTFQCGRECRPNYYKSWYRSCGEYGECVSIESPCNGECQSGRFLCGNRCKRVEDESRYRECNGSCLSYWNPCNGVCPNNTQSCGNNNSASQLCLPDDYPRASDYYRECGDQCISTYQACDGNCTKGYFLCGEEECIRETYREWYRDCNGSCLDYWYPCNGVCQNNTQSCGNSNSDRQLCLPDDEPWASYYYRQCGDDCISWYYEACDITTTSAPSTTPAPTITIDVEVDVQDVSITYSNDQPQECEARNLGGGAAGNAVDIPLLPACGDMTISAAVLCFGCPVVEDCQYNGPQRSVVIEATPGGGCSIQAI